MQALNDESVSNILSSMTLDNTQDVFSHLYSSTKAKGLASKSWETMNLENLDFKEIIAIISIPKPKTKDTKVMKGFTGNLNNLKELIKSNHILALKNEVELNEITETLTQNPKKGHIIIQNIITGNYTIYEITPNGYKFETSTDKQIKKPAQNTTPTQISNILLQIG